MDLRRLTDEISVSPQIAPSDMPALAAAGFRSVIANRPDAEVGADLSAETMRAAAEAAGLRFTHLPVSPATGMTPDLVAGMAHALDELPGPVLAYCRSGTRSANLWALASSGRLPADTILAAGRDAGYDLSPLAPYLR